jgi:hypothetical protein
MLFLDRSIYLSFCIDSRRPPAKEGRSESFWISPEAALEHIKKYIEKEEEVEAKKETERQIIAMWLTQATSNYN